MRVIIAGPRNFDNFEEVVKAVKESGFQVTEIVSGAAKGADTLGEEYADINGVPKKRFPAKWNNIKGKDPKHIKVNKWGKKYYVLAGFDRNQEMADYADALIAIDLGTSGTADMIKRMEKAGKKIYRYVPGDDHYDYSF